ncbi:MAG: hypothetical protein A4E39_01640 [Methanoregulaceae archaeon PtaB.Bin152]|nr:MAG: hypothetical protein A4E39_01640 [Methanoregulaceae archaeon PtaB.Bin152]
MILQHSYLIRKDLEDPDDQIDPWQSTPNPWVAEVYETLFMRRRDRM